MNTLSLTNSPPNISSMIKQKMLRFAGRVALRRLLRNTHKILITKGENEKLGVTPIIGWEGHIKADVKDVDCFHVIQDRTQWRAVVHTVMNI
jgi:hypothetical protein